MLLSAKVKPNSPGFSIEPNLDSYTIHVSSKPENNQANLEIVKELGRLFGKEVKIVRGLKSKNKVILVNDITEREFKSKILGP